MLEVESQCMVEVFESLLVVLVLAVNGSYVVVDVTQEDLVLREGAINQLFLS